MTAEVYAEFTLSGNDLNPEEVTSKVGIQPTKTWYKDDLISPKATARYQQSGWSLRSHLETSDDLGEHFHVVLEQLKQNWQAVAELCSIYDAEFCGVIYTPGDRPTIHFDRATLNAVLQLNAEIDVDLYVLPPETLEAQNDIYPTATNTAGVESELSPERKRHITTEIAIASMELLNSERKKAL